MCNFLSGLALPNGDLLALPEYTDSHSDLIQHFGFIDDGREPEIQRFVRVEFSPQSMADAADVSRYALKLDEDRTPPWWDAIRESVQEKMAAMVRRMIVTDKRPLLLGGCWILGGHAVVRAAKNVRIVTMLESSKVGEMLGSSNVGAMCDSSNVGAMLGSSNVGAMLGSSKVGKMLGSSNISTMRDSSNVGAMCDSSNVCEMLDSSNVCTMCDSSNVCKMLGSSKVGKMLGSSNISTMWDSSNAPNPPKNDFRNKPGQAS